MKWLWVFVTIFLISGCLENYNEPHIEAFNGVNIQFPTYGHAVYRAMVLQDRLTTEQTAILVSALPLVIDAVLFTQFENCYDRFKQQFSDTDVTFFYQYLRQKAILDEAGGFYNGIKDWHITPNNIAFTLYIGMHNHINDEY